ncbi:hypothetical protein [Methanobrevibacter oralis]|uniref:Double zinc ribbon n=1 Tax=Methanobrevibacter oralis TaxID=66851 RepID=A0A166BIJ5_METOA|nr:hypothetical protein [Methanobrevibacter oralis]KZX13401.1 hypothetical protein MBORA_06290 [Methanobrevibacter oralis]
MCECPECGEKTDEENVEFECPFCSKDDMGEGFYTCENCETLFDYKGDLWECEFCHKGSTQTDITNNEDEEYLMCPDCGEELEDDSYCFNCGWPNNQGWIGEHYG